VMGSLSSESQSRYAAFAHVGRRAGSFPSFRTFLRNPEEKDE
jgi:hypothetical protein